MKIKVRIAGREFSAEVGDLKARPIVVQVDGREFQVWPEEAGARPAAAPRPRPAAPAPVRQPAARPAETGRAVRAPIPGVIASVAVQPGQTVTVGQELCVLEAMKMKNAIRSGRDGTVGAVHVSAGQHVTHNDLLVEFAD